MEEIIRTKRQTIKNSIRRSFIIYAVCDIARMSEPRWEELYSNTHEIRCFYTEKHHFYYRTNVENSLKLDC